MHISCVICSDLFVAADDTFGTQCGHLFHYQCLIQWIERSKSCPQCRNKTTEKSIHRIYFNIPNVTEHTEDPSVLYNRIDGLNFQIRLKDTDIKNTSEENAKFKDQNLALREELKNEASKIRTLNLSVESLKEQINFLRTQNKEVESTRNETKSLRKQLELLNNVQTVILGSSTDVDDMLNNHGTSPDCVKQLATFVSVLKRELQTETDKKRRISTKLKENDKELIQARTENYKLKLELKALTESKEHLEQDVKHHEEEVRSLQKKIKKLEQAIISPTASKHSALHRLIAESPAPLILKKPRLTNPDGNESTQTSEKVDDSLNLVESPVTSKSSVLSVKVRPSPTKVFKFRSMPSSSKFSIFKRSRMGQLEGNSTVVHSMEEMYDGHGGHSKLDEFPRPTPKFKTHKQSPHMPTIRLNHRKHSKKLSTNTGKLEKFLYNPE